MADQETAGLTAKVLTVSDGVIAGTREDRSGEDEEAIKRMFTPEFRNRLDKVIQFAALPPPVVAQVVDKFVMQLEAQLGDRNVAIELSGEARDWLAGKGFDPAFGARPLARVIQEHIKTPLADELLFGKLAKGGLVRVVLKGDGLGFRFRRPPAPARRERERPGGGSGDDKVPELVD